MSNSTQTIDAIETITGCDSNQRSSPPQAVSIEKIIAGGYGLARQGSQVVLVPGTLPGEKLSVQIGEKRRGVHQAHILKIIQSSEDRIEPACAIAGQCGGCQFQHQTYQSQIHHKRAILQEALWRIGKLSVPDIPPVLPSPQDLHYRTTVRFVVFKQSRGFQLGFFRRGSRIPIPSDQCLLIPEPAKGLVARVAQCLSAQPTLPVFLESLEIRWSTLLGQGLVIFRGKCRHPHQTAGLLKIIGPLKTVAGVVCEFAQSDSPWGSKTSRAVAGQEYILERFLGLTLRIGYRSFLQANWPVYEALGERLLGWGGDLQGQCILELYSGVGALGLSLARMGSLVTLVESNAYALADARRSAALSHVSRCRFRSQTAEAYLSQTHVGDYEAIIVDPPRTGLGPGTIQELVRIRVPRLFYISCDPATLARDLSRLHSFGYRINRIQPFDLFPQTAHIETLVELTL